jgi:PhnB protein
MTDNAKPIPDGYRAVTPYMIVNNAEAAIEFYKQAFGAKEIVRFPRPDGRVMHAEIQIDDSRIMLADEAPELDARSPRSFGGSPVSFHVYVRDVDATFSQAVAAGAKVKRDLKNQFYGDRTAGVTDPFGHVWYLATHVEDVSPEEMQRRATAASD